MSLADELEKIERLYQGGSLSDDEYARAKQKLLKPSVPLWPDSGVSPEEQTRFWAMVLHLSLLAGYAVPLGGFILPIAIWQIKKTELPELDVHGKIVANWILSHLIYVVVSALLVVAVIGIPMLIALGAISVAFPIVGAIKANSGEAWRYPLSITFFA